MFKPVLPDPRAFAHPTLKNNLVIAFHQWSASPPEAKPAAESHVRFLLEQAMAAGEDKLLAVALSLMPSAQAYRQLWQWMAEASFSHPRASAVPFALPVVAVAGSPQPVTVPGELAEVAGLRELWREAAVFPAAAEIWLSNRLLSPGALTSFTPATVYEWSLRREPAHAGWPTLPVPAPLKDVAQEGAHLRFLPGVLVCPDPVDWPRSTGRWGREASERLSAALGAAGATVLALPRPPQPLLLALEDGRRAQQEVAVQLFIGNALRHFRERGREPAAVLAVHDDHALRLCLDDGETPFAHVRPLTALDDLPAIEQEWLMLLEECRVERVHRIAEIQPGQIGGKAHVCGIETLARA